MIKFQKFLLLAIVLNLAHFAGAQSQEKIYSVLIMNFVKGIEWPNANAGGKFIIGVLEYPPLATELKSSILNTHVNGKNIEIKEYSRAEDIQSCHILFIPAYKSKNWATVLNKFPTQPTLMVSNKMDFARQGGGIDFVLMNGKLRYEINCKSIEQRGMKVSSNVKGMGIVLE